MGIFMVTELNLKKKQKKPAWTLFLVFALQPQGVKWTYRNYVVAANVTLTEYMHIL